MSDSKDIILIDLPSKPPGPRCWSGNPWKTRFVLNYKKLPYTTQWVEYPDLEPTLKPHLPPNKEGYSDYTSPAIKLPDGTWMMDSRVIADKLESLHPTPSLHLTDPHLDKVDGIMNQMMPALAGVYLPLVVPRLLNEASIPHCLTTREKWFGMPLEQFGEKFGGEQAYKNAKPALDEATELLKANTSGPYFMGETVSYADFVWAGFWIFMQRLGDDVFQKVLDTTSDASVHLALLKGVEEWSARDSY